MIDMQRLREELGQFNGRYAISLNPPVRPRSRPPVARTTTITLNEAWAGLQDDSTQEQIPNDSDWQWRELFEELDDAVGSHGIEALAWYVSFHNSGDDWGVYIPLSSVHYLAAKWFSGRGVRKQVAMDVGYKLLLDHETFHFAADLAQTQIELMTYSACRRWYAESLPAGSYHETEEALANAFAFLRARTRGTSSRQLSKIADFMASQPAGYRDAVAYLGNSEDYREGLTEVVKAYVAVPLAARNPSLPVSLIDWPRLFDLAPSELLNCPVHIIADDHAVGLPPLAPRMLAAIPSLRETPKFQRQFRRLARPIQEAWNRKKTRLAHSVPGHPEFEKLKDRDLYSIRVNRQYRAHLRPIPGRSDWEAVEIGTHTELGHD